MGYLECQAHLECQVTGTCIILALELLPITACCMFSSCPPTP